MLELSHLKESSIKASRALICLLVTATLIGSASSYADSFGNRGATSGLGIHLTIIPATTPLVSAPQNPFSTIESALSSDQLYRLELDSTLLADFSIENESGTLETPAELISRLEQAVNDIELGTAVSSSENKPVVLTLSAG